MTKPTPAKLNPDPKFPTGKAKFNGRYFRKRMREIRRLLPKGGAF